MKKYLTHIILLILLLSNCKSKQSFNIKIIQKNQSAILHDLIHEITDTSIKVSYILPKEIKSNFSFQTNQFPLGDSIYYQAKLNQSQTKRLHSLIRKSNFDTLQSKYEIVENPIHLVFKIDIENGSLKETITESYHSPILINQFIKEIDLLIPDESSKIHPNKESEKEINIPNKYETLENGTRRYIWGQNIIATNRKFSVEQYRLEEDWFLELKKTHYKGYTFIKIKKGISQQKTVQDFEGNDLPSVQQVDIQKINPSTYKIDYYHRDKISNTDTISLN